MDKDERKKAILEALARSPKMSVQELARLTEVSHMTVRRDLSLLAREGKVQVFHGGAVLAKPASAMGGESCYSLIAAGCENREKKLSIGRLAATLIEPGDNLIIDAGSTAEYFAKCLPEDNAYTVLCYALNVVSETVRRKNITTLFSGGIFHENTLMFESSEGLAMIRRFRATKAFVTASGASEQFGVTCMNPYERETKRAVIQSSMKKILLVDSSKFGLVRSDYFADLSEFDQIVTDSGISPEYMDIIRAKGISLLIA